MNLVFFVKKYVHRILFAVIGKRDAFRLANTVLWHANPKSKPDSKTVRTIGT